METSTLTMKDGVLGMKEKVPQDRVFASLDCLYKDALIKGLYLD